MSFLQNGPVKICLCPHKRVFLAVVVVLLMLMILSSMMLGSNDHQPKMTLISRIRKPGHTSVSSAAKAKIQEDLSDGSFKVVGANSDISQEDVDRYDWDAMTAEDFVRANAELERRRPHGDEESDRRDFESLFDVDDSQERGSSPSTNHQKESRASKVIKTRYSDLYVGHAFNSSPYIVDFETAQEIERRKVPKGAARRKPKYRIAIFNQPDWFNHWGHSFKKCEYNNCEYTQDKEQEKADLLIFHGVRIFTPRPPPRPPGQLWIMMGNESPIHYSGFLHSTSWRGVFNFTVTYRTDSDIFAPYGVLVEKEKPPSGYLESMKYINITKSKTKNVAWIVSKCETDSKREVYVRELRKYIDIDIFGKCGKPICPKDDDCIPEVLQQYRFYLSFENSLCTDYVTEKFFRLFENDGIDIIPVVRGGMQYKKYLPEGIFIDASDFESPKALAEHLLYLSHQQRMYSEMIMHKARYRRMKSRRLCKMCEILNLSQGKQQVYKNIFAWVMDGMCHEPTDINFSHQARERG